MMLVKRNGKEEIRSPQMTGIKAQTLKEIESNLKCKTSEVVLRNNETVRS